MSVHYVTGDDPTLREDALTRVVDELLGDDDRSLAFEEHTVPGRSGDTDVPGGAAGRELAVAAAMNAVLSPPFMTQRRVVVLRDAGNLSAGDAAPIITYLDDQVDTTELVLVAGGGRLPANLTKAWKGIVEQHSPDSERTEGVLAAAMAETDLTLDRDVARHIEAHLGENAGRVPQLVAVLEAAFEDGTTLGVDDVEPYLGGEGSVPSYQLTNAIEEGDVAASIATLHRLLDAPSARDGKPMHPLQVIGMLVSSYRRLLRLDDPDITSPAQAVQALGGRVKEYPARKALGHARALGPSGIRRAFELLAQADLDLKGASAVPEEMTMEILVARLAQLSARSGGGRSGSGRSGRRNAGRGAGRG